MTIIITIKLKYITTTYISKSSWIYTNSDMF